jgi:hypothetical protein
VSVLCAACPASVAYTFGTLCVLHFGTPMMLLMYWLSECRGAAELFCLLLCSVGAVCSCLAACCSITTMWHF